MPCGGKGIVIQRMTLIKGGDMATALKVRAAVKSLSAELTDVECFEHRKPEFIQTVREETLELWQRELLKDVEELRIKLRQALGGLVQIEQEAFRRKELKEKRITS
jgi:DNA polymerase III delta prime subunit